jgi:PASTA domain
MTNISGRVENTKSEHVKARMRSLKWCAIATPMLMTALLSGCGSDGPGNVSEPNVVGDSQSVASAAITAAGLKVGTVATQSSTTVATGLVISQDPAAGSSEPGGTAVALTISSGPPTVAAPNVVGDTQSAATTALIGAGLKVGTVTMQSRTTVSTGKVISESPGAGTSVVVGSAVGLVVSSGVTFSGVAASGYPIANNPGYALDAATGTQIPFLTEANGSFSVNVFGYAGPFLLHVLGVTAGAAPVNLYSLAAASSGGTTINVTPLSDVVLAYAAGVTTQNLESACTGTQSACPALLNGILAKLSAANGSVVKAIPASVLTAFGITPSTFNAITTQFEATHTGVDGLLDALSVVPPVTTGGSYTISLLSATPALLATVPTSGTPGTEGGAPVAGAAPASASVAQAVNLAAVEGEIQNYFAAFTAVFATQASRTAANVQMLLTTDYLNDGNDAAQQAAIAVSQNGQPVGVTITGGGVAPYSYAPIPGAVGAGTPGPAVTYDANNCVSTIWVYFNLSPDPWELTDTIPTTNSAGACTGGKWLTAGDGRTYQSQLSVSFARGTTHVGGTPTYKTNFRFITESSQTTSNPNAAQLGYTAYTYVVVGGPGITSIGATMGVSGATTGYYLMGPQSPVTAPAVLPPENAIYNTQTYAIDEYYASGDVLQTCAEILASGSSYYNNGTPCYNSGVVAGSDYGTAFYDASFNLLAWQEARLTITPAAVSVPTSYYPIITSITPAQASSIVAGTAATIVTDWTLPAGGADDSQGASLSAGDTPIFNFENNLDQTATTNSISVPALTLQPTSGGAHINIIIGGLTVSASTGF